MDTPRSADDSQDTASATYVVYAVDDEFAYARLPERDPNGFFSNETRLPRNNYQIGDAVTFTLKYMKWPMAGPGDL